LNGFNSVATARESVVCRTGRYAVTSTGGRHFTEQLTSPLLGRPASLLRSLTQACPPHKLYTRTYTLRRPLFPARLAAIGRRWLRQAVAQPAQPPIKHRPRELRHSALPAASSCFCSTACGDVLTAATPFAMDAKAAPTTLRKSRRSYRLPNRRRGGRPMVRTWSYFARQQCSNAGRARPPPGYATGAGRVEDSCADR
jgi:hypothetical protein